MSMDLETKNGLVEFGFMINPMTQAHVSLVWHNGRYKLYAFDGERQVIVHFDAGARAKLAADSSNPPEMRVMPS